MKSFAKITQCAWALGVLILFLANGTSVHAAVKKSAPVKKPVAKAQPKNVIPWKEIEAVVKKSIMEPDATVAMDNYYTFSHELLERLDVLNVSEEEFHALVEGNDRAPEPPKSVDILKRYNYSTAKKGLVGIFYAARFLPRAGGTSYGMFLLTKTEDDEWKIDPSYSLWFIRKSCVSPMEWIRTDIGWKRDGVNQTCDNSIKTFKGIDPKNDKAIGAKVRAWAKPFLAFTEASTVEESQPGGDIAPAE